MTDSPEEVAQATEPSEPQVSDALVESVGELLQEGAFDRAVAEIEPLHAADQADLLQLLDDEDRERLVLALAPQFDPEVLSHLQETVRDGVIELLGPRRVGEAIARLETDDAVDIIEDLDEDERQAVLDALPMPERAAVEQALAYPEDSAGRLMQRDFVAVPEYWIVGQTIDYLRAHPDLPDDFYEIYIVDPHFHPVGSIPLSRVLRSRRTVRMSDLTMKDLHLVPVDMDQEDIGFVFSQYGLVSAPVVDGEGRLAGVVTVDDVVEVIQEEAEEDILKLGGVQETDIFESPWRTGLKRLPWLCMNLVTAIVASLVIALFDDQIAQLVALAVLMPIVASMGGNAGTQTLTVTVRALAMHEVTAANAARVLGKEFVAGGFNGLLFMAVGVGLAVVWFGDLMLGVIFGIATLINMIAAALAGVTIPLVLDRFGLDPAVSSGVFLTTVTDVVGFFAFLGLAAWYLL